MKPYWISWYHIKNLGAFELHAPWWVSGQRGEDKTICAAVIASSEEDAKQQVMKSFDVVPNDLEWRFCTEKPADWIPFSERFPRADWMKWDAPQPS